MLSASRSDARDEVLGRGWLGLKKDNARTGDTNSTTILTPAINISTFGNPKVEIPTTTIGKDGKARPTKYKTRAKKVLP